MSRNTAQSKCVEIPLSFSRCCNEQSFSFSSYSKDWPDFVSLKIHKVELLSL